MRLLLDTNIFVQGFLDLADGKNSPEVKILNALMEKKEVVLISKTLEEQLLRVVLRFKDRNFTGLLRHMLWSDFNLEFVNITDLGIRKKFEDFIPRKDLDIFLTAHIGNADYMVSNDAELIEKATRIQDKFRCLSAEEFVKKFNQSFL